MVFSPAITPQHDIKKIVDYITQSEDKKLTVDLEKRIISFGQHNAIFQIDSISAHRLINGLDSIGLTLEKEGYISSYEKKNNSKGWL